MNQYQLEETVCKKRCWKVEVTQSVKQNGEKFGCWAQVKPKFNSVLIGEDFILYIDNVTLICGRLLQKEDIMRQVELCLTLL